MAYWIAGDIQTTSTVNAANNATEIIIEDLLPKHNYTFQITSIGNGGVSTLSLTRTEAMTSLVPGKQLRLVYVLFKTSVFRYM